MCRVCWISEDLWWWDVAWNYQVSHGWWSLKTWNEHVVAICSTDFNWLIWREWSLRASWNSIIFKSEHRGEDDFGGWFESFRKLWCRVNTTVRQCRTTNLSEIPCSDRRMLRMFHMIYLEWLVAHVSFPAWNPLPGWICVWVPMHPRRLRHNLSHCCRSHRIHVWYINLYTLP